MTFRFEQVDIDSDNNSCYLHYCLTTLSLQPECRNCNFTLPVISPETARNNSWNPVLLKWAPKSNITGDLIISNSEVSQLLIDIGPTDLEITKHGSLTVVSCKVIS